MILVWRPRRLGWAWCVVGAILLGGSSIKAQQLGLQTKADPEMQHRLDERTHDLKVHQRLGLLTLAPLAAACISSAAAPPDPKNGSGNTVGRDIHVSLGSLSVSMYALTAYYAIRAPRGGA